MEGVRGGGGFAELLRRRRTAARLTQEQLAARAGLNVRSVSQLERGLVRHPRPENVRLLGVALGLTGADLVAFHEAARAGYWSDREEPVAPAPPDPGRRGPAQLPGDVVAFTGRGAELSTLDAMLDASGDAVVISAVSGTAGVGKTALALHWAHRVAHRFPDGQLYVNLRGYDPELPLQPGDALAGFLRALGLTGTEIPADLDERAARYRTELSGRRMLVVLDNAATVEQVRPLLPGTATALVVVTSRDSLAGLVAVHGARRVELDLLPAGDAVALLRRLAGPRLDDDAAATSALAGQCARLPLALRVAAELAAARSGSSVAELVDELADERRRLELLDAGGDPRGAVNAVFSWSYRHLPAAAAGLFRLLGLHPGPDIDAYAAAALGGSGLGEARRQLDMLARAHLVAVIGPGRYGMHDLLRVYAADLALSTDGQATRDAALRRLFDYYLAAAGAAMDELFPAETHRRPRFPPPVPAPGGPAGSWLVAELPNLAAMAASSAAAGWAEYPVGLSTTLFRYLILEQVNVALTIHAHAHAAARAAGDRARAANALNSMAVAHAHSGQLEKAGELIRQATAEAREAGDPTGMIRGLSNLGIVELRMGRYPAAIEYMNEARDVARGIGDRLWESDNLTNIARAEERLGRYEAALGHLGQSLALLRDDAGAHVGKAQALTNLGIVHQAQGRHDTALRYHLEALGLSRGYGDRISTAYILLSLGDTTVRLGRTGEAAGHYGEALGIMREVGDRYNQPWALTGLAGVALTEGRVAEAVAGQTAALAMATEDRNRLHQARALEGRAAARHALGDAAGAREDRERAHMLYQTLGMPDAERVRGGTEQ